MKIGEFGEYYTTIYDVSTQVESMCKLSFLHKKTLQQCFDSFVHLVMRREREWGRRGIAVASLFDGDEVHAMNPNQIAVELL